MKRARLYLGFLFEEFVNLITVYRVFIIALVQVRNDTICSLE